MKSLLKAVLLVLCLGLAVAVGAIVFNNASLSRLNQDNVRVQLTNGIYLGTTWTREHAQDLLTRPNAALFHMITDMAHIANNDVMMALSATYLRQPDHSIWRRLSDKNRPVDAPSVEKAQKLQDYQRWILYAVDPVKTPLGPEERTRMFDPEMHSSGSLTHQLFALKIYRDFQGPTTDLDALIDHLCERIAREAVIDFRVSDLYLQRVAFLLAAGRPDLVKRRWVERILANQRDDGGWTYPWYWWGPGLFRFHTHLQSSTAHPTIQGLWALYQIQYRYPDWITTHYRE